MATHHQSHTDNHAAHDHGTMDISEQVRTYHGFIRLAVWTAGLSIGVLIFLALTNA